MEAARANAAAAGVAASVTIEQQHFEQARPTASAGLVVTNPPYGERIDPKGQGSAHARMGGREGFEDVDAGAAGFFSALAAHWKRQYPGWTAWLLSPQRDLPTVMRLKESRRVPLWNGPIECRMFRFDIVAGSARTRTAEAGPGSTPS